MQYAIETADLTKRFGDTVAVDHVGLAVPAGAFYGFLGPNGAGKSTTIKCLTGLLRQDEGRIRILDLDPRSHDLDIKRQAGVIPEDEALFERLTGAETLTLVARVHGLPSEVAEQRRSELLALLGLANAAGKLVADYSHGMRKKLALAVALLPAPRVLFLDEPFEGIDPLASHQIKELLQRFAARGGTVFLTSHILEIIERLADHVGIIHQGRLVAQGPTAEVTAGRSLEEAFIAAVGAPPAGAHALEWLA